MAPRFLRTKCAIIDDGKEVLKLPRPYLRKLWLSNRDGGCSSDVIVFRSACQDLSPDYLFAALSQDRFFDYVMKKPRGTKMPRGDRDWMKQFEFPLPPLSVQREIVARLESELGAVDKLAKKFEELEAAAEAEFKAELKETFEGFEKFERFEGFERAGGDEMVGRSVPDRRNHMITKNALRDGCGGEGTRRPTAVRWVKLGEVYETGAGGTPLKSHRDYYDNGDIPWLRSGEVCCRDITSAELCITRKGLENSSAKMFPANSVLVAMYGATAGQVGILRFEAATNQAICAILPSATYVPEFMYYQLVAKEGEMVAQAVGGAQPNISQIKIRSLDIVLPPLAVQRSIVARLDAAKAKKERLVAAAKRGRETAALWRKAILKEAFE